MIIIRYLEDQSFLDDLGILGWASCDASRDLVGVLSTYTLLTLCSFLIQLYPKNTHRKIANLQIIYWASCFIMRFNLLTLFLPSLVSASVGGHCAGDHPDSICLYTSTCDQYHGSRFVGGCPNDPTDVQCCTINNCIDDSSFCTWTGPNNDCSGIPYAVFVKGK